MEWLSLISTLFSSGLNPGVETIMLRADDYRGIRLDFCPPWYANEFVGRGESKAEIYLRELGQHAVARNIEATSYGHATFFPGRARMCNRFELYDTCRPERFDQQSNGAQMYVNGKGSKAIFRVKRAAVGHFL